MSRDAELEICWHVSRLRGRNTTTLLSCSQSDQVTKDKEFDTVMIFRSCEIFSLCFVSRIAVLTKHAPTNTSCCLHYSRSHLSPTTTRLYESATPNSWSAPLSCKYLHVWVTVMKALMPRFIRSSTASRYAVCMNQVGGGGGGGGVGLVTADRVEVGLLGGGWWWWGGVGV